MISESGRTERQKTNGAAHTESIVLSESADCMELVCWPGPMVVVGHAELPDPLDRRLLLLADPTSAPARCYRLLRHRLLTSGDPRVIGVTSASPGEGKTTCAANLALGIAEDALGSVLLLDANVRRPALAELFGLGAVDAVQISDSGHDPCYSVTAIGATRLHVASAIGGGPSSLGRLDRHRFAELLSDLRAAYDYVITDAASVLESGDADVVSELSDGVIVTVRGTASRRRVVGRAIDQLQPANILGLVVIDAWKGSDA